MDDVLRALAEPRRLELLRLLGDGEMAAGEIAAQFPLTRQAISQHLQVLKTAGLLDERKQGTRRMYQLRPEALVELRDFLDGFWPAGLADLKRSAEREATQARSRTPPGNG